MAGSAAPAAQLAAQALLEIYAHARAEYPREACGLVMGARGAPGAIEVRRCRNVQDQLHAADPVRHPRDARTAYALDAAELLVLDRSLRGDRPVKVVYHSHVDVGAYFSRTDREVALAGWEEPAYPVDYLVVDARADGIAEARLFAWDRAARDFVEVARYPGERAARERG